MYYLSSLILRDNNRKYFILCVVSLTIYRARNCADVFMMPSPWYVVFYCANIAKWNKILNLKLMQIMCNKITFCSSVNSRASNSAGGSDNTRHGSRTGRTADSRCRCCRTRVRVPRPPCPRRCSRVRSTSWGRRDAANRCPLGVARVLSRSPVPPLGRWGCPLAPMPPSRLPAAAACRWLKSFCLKKKKRKFMTAVYENPKVTDKTSFE